MKPLLLQFAPLAILLFTVCSPATARQTIFATPLSDRIVQYSIDVTLDVDAKTLTGRQRVSWRNTSTKPVSDLQFHLYLNAFKNSETTLMREAGGVLRNNTMGAKDWGWIDVVRMKTLTGEDLSARMQFIQPDDGNVHDQTVLRVVLPRAVPAGETIVVELDFTARLPKLVRRTGYMEDYYMVGQWFPKLGVYEPAGMRYSTNDGWNCHQFHANTEFYADFGVYDVRITLPKAYVVGATGILVSDVVRGDTARTLTFRAEDVHDFAWTASPDYRVVEKRWRNVSIRLLTHEHRLGEIANRYVRATEHALEYFADWLMPYPYPMITVVDPAFRAEEGGGMEYPMLITGGSLRGLPSTLRLTEIVTVHEFGHQYWYGMIGSNEFEEAWLDEGVNQYSEGRIMSWAYGKQTSTLDLWGIRIGDEEQTRLQYTGMRYPNNSPIAMLPWNMAPGSYSALSYAKTAVVLATLEGLVGREVMDEIMKTFFMRWKFKHPCERDLRAVVNEVVSSRLRDRFSEGMDWYFDQTLHGTEICDYAVANISSSPQRSKRGRFEDSVLTGTGRLGPYESVVILARKGGIRLPVEFRVTFEDGSTRTDSWDGQERWKRYTYTHAAPVTEVTIDPHKKIPLDISLLNNSMTVSPDPVSSSRVAWKVFQWVQNLFSMMMMF